MADRQSNKRTPTKREIMHDLLGRLGDDRMALDEFWRRLAHHDMTDDDIDRYLAGTLQ